MKCVMLALQKKLTLAIHDNNNILDEMLELHDRQCMQQESDEVWNKDEEISPSCGDT